MRVAGDDVGHLGYGPFPHPTVTILVVIRQPDPRTIAVDLDASTDSVDTRLNPDAAFRLVAFPGQSRSEPRATGASHYLEGRSCAAIFIT